jgi:hypothetical protein
MSASLSGGAVEMERGAVLPFGDDALADFVFVDLRRGRRLLDFRKRKAVALLHIENRVVAENKRNALARTSTLSQVQKALEKAGVEFLNDGQPGVRLKHVPR